MEQESDSAAQDLEAGSEIADRPEAMKLVVRSPYWGRVLKGKTRRDFDHGGPSYRVIACQVVLSAREGQYWGCCPHHGKRVLELKEYHFTDHFEGDWDVYMIGNSVSPSYNVHAFFMLPQNQTVIDLQHKIHTQGWTYLGPARASVVRLDLEQIFSEILRQNDTLQFRFHHVHLEILMDQVFDRETPRSRKAAIEKSRTDRNPHFLYPAGATAATAISSVGSPSPNRAPNLAPEGRLSTSSPPIPNGIPSVVSNDASFFSDAATQSSAGYPDATAGVWSLESASLPPAHYQPPPHHPHLAYHPAMAWMGPEGVQWYPASMANHALHRGYVAGSNPLLPPNVPNGFLTGGVMDQHFHPGYPVGDPRLRVDHHPSHNFYPVEGPHMRMSQEEGYGNEEAGAGLSADDEKDNEEVATASVSETTLEEDISTTQP